MHTLLAPLHTLLPGLHTLPAWAAWALLLAAGLFGTLCWMVVTRLAWLMWALTPAGHRAQRLEHQAALAQAERILHRMKQPAAPDV